MFGKIDPDFADHLNEYQTEVFIWLKQNNMDRHGLVGYPIPGDTLFLDPFENSLYGFDTMGGWL